MSDFPHASRNRLTWAALCGLLLAAGDAVAQQQTTAWKTGPMLRRQLDEAVGITWQDRSLREGLEHLSRAYGVAVFLDRQIDPGQLISITVRDAPLESLLRQIATAIHAETALLSSVVYIGPPATTSQLNTLVAMRRQDVSRLPNDMKAQFSKVEAWQWPELAQPRELLRNLARQIGVTTQNPEAVPHDLWPAVSLPPLPWVDRMTLLLASFDLTFEFDSAATSLRIVPAPTHAILEKRYTPRGNAADLATQLRRVLPEMEIRVEQGQLVAAGKQEDHDKIERLLAGQSVRTVKPQKKGAGEKLFSLQVANEPAGKVVRKVAESIDKELSYDPALLEKLRHPVTFNLKDATLEHLMETTLKPLGLTYRITDKQLEVIAPQ